MSEDRDLVQFCTEMPRRLRKDALQNADHGEMSEMVRDLFRKKAYGPGVDGKPTELELLEAELREKKDQLNKLQAQKARVIEEIEINKQGIRRIEEQINSIDGSNQSFNDGNKQ